jgi:hypothetical protein
MNAFPDVTRLLNKPLLCVAASRNCKKNTTSLQGHGFGGRIRWADFNQRVSARALTSLEVKCYVERHAFAARGSIALGWL